MWGTPLDMGGGRFRRKMALDDIDAMQETEKMAGAEIWLYSGGRRLFPDLLPEETRVQEQKE